MTRRHVSEAITAVLKPAGFHRKGTRWYRTIGYSTDVVALTTSKAGDSVSVELGVFDPVPYRQIWAIPKTITEADCVVRIDLGHLTGVMGAWDPDDPGSIDEPAKLLRLHGLAWLDALQTRKERVDYLRHLRERKLIPSESVLLALSEAAIGEIHDSRHRLRSLRSKLEGPWAEVVDTLLARLDGEGTRASDIADTLAFLQEWLLAQSDGDWEDDQGIVIESLDNPGWCLKIGLAGTGLAGIEQPRRELNEDRPSWVEAWADGVTFEAACGPLGLTAAIEEFRRFVQLHADTATPQ